MVSRRRSAAPTAAASPSSTPPAEAKRKGEWYNPNSTPFNLYDWREWLMLLSGIATLLVTGPPVAIVIFLTVVWEAIDRGFKGGFVESGNELSGLLMGKFIPWFDRLTAPFNRRFVKKPDDAFLVNVAWYYGLGMPLMLRTAGNLHLAGDYSPYLICLVYPVLRMGWAPPPRRAPSSPSPPIPPGAPPDPRPAPPRAGPSS